ncbi:MAG: hypothetical protein HN718_15030 [Rhodospirillales bacterium]|jgi:uncharacterized membrane protein|nr:hypothetical protein [Rhodospirillales bacterium]MBT5352326.1 hypothetical protein [Rhodospirillales bacterium]MBT5520972.1 hypothetical protein [Rhodospirillales bacterium]MBT6111635.1 hypothetical protein [Rhodospirillales bacterium]MBT6825205.1 hypothetical protein [Rhodospirillales bacterium]
MTGATTTVMTFAPIVPVWLVVTAGLVLLGLTVVVVLHRARGGVLRLAAFAIMFLVLLGPYYQREQRESQDDVVLVMVDQSASQSVENRQAQRDEALKKVRAAIAADPSLEPRYVNFGAYGASSSDDADEGTLLRRAMVSAAADVPRDRYAGAIVITDGQVHDMDDTAAGGALPDGPLHVLLTGEREALDRRVAITRAPGYGLVGHDTSIAFQVDENRAASGAVQPVPVTLTVDGQVISRRQVMPGKETVIGFSLDHAGSSVVEVSAETVAGELTTINNAGVATINGVRDRLRVLLISGQPHAGERTWRNLLKSDPAVDLIHFTILRPPEKSDFTPVQELSLITFPTFELFDIKIDDFDLMVFDRYVVRHVLAPRYFRNIENFVRKGGGLLVVVGPEYAGSRSLNETAVGDILPVRPTGTVMEQGFYPRLSDLGRIHPVTAPLTSLSGEPGEVPAWGRWLRQVESTMRDGSGKSDVLMQGINDQPLVMLNRIDDGRVGMLTSDQIWLWARGFEGGGPQAELLRRMAHWIMKEPALEEEQLSAKLSGQILAITRKSMKALPTSVTVIVPGGERETVALNKSLVAGEASGSYQVGVPGVYRIEDGEHTTLAAVGSLNPMEYSDLRASEDILKPYATASGGGMWWLSDMQPDIRRTKENRDQRGRDWMGLRNNQSYVVTGIASVQLLPGWLAAGLIIFLLMAAWWREAR